ncbi:MAG: YutD family protein [Tenericutes bacterium]|nr:YutD family protein [Mycoplasmatota bacterium]
MLGEINMLETTHGEFELIKNNRDGFVLDDFNKRYLDVLGIYPFIVGDYAAGLLRLKGFSNDNYKQIPDYIVESCAPGCAYFILKNPNFNPHLNRKE